MIWPCSQICGTERSSWTSLEELGCPLQAAMLFTEEMTNKICKIKARLSTSPRRLKIEANSTLREPKRGRQRCMQKSTKWLKVLNFSGSRLIGVFWAMNRRLKTSSFKDHRKFSKSPPLQLKGLVLIKFSVFSRRKLQTQTLQNNRWVCWINKILQRSQNLDNLKLLSQLKSWKSQK